MIHLDKIYQKIITTIVQTHAPTAKILAFGSRVKGTHAPASDVDIALDAGAPIHWLTIATIKEDLMESDIPYQVDVLDYHSVADYIQQTIDHHHHVL